MFKNLKNLIKQVKWLKLKRFEFEKEKNLKCNIVLLVWR